MPTPDTNDDPIEWTLVDTDLTTVLAVLPAATNSNLYLELNEPGSGNVSVPLLSTSAALIESGQFVRAKYRGALRGAISFLRSSNVVSKAEAEAAVMVIPKDKNLWS